MTTETLNNTGRLTALFSFLIGTGIFAQYLAIKDLDIAFLGLGYIAFSVLVNLLLIIFIIKKAILDKENREGLLATSCLMLLNIPIAAIYSWIFFSTVL